MNWVKDSTGRFLRRPYYSPQEIEARCEATIIDHLTGRHGAVEFPITTDDLIGGVVKPIVFSLIIGTIACRQGLSTEGGTVGVGRSTTRAVVMASITVIIADYFLAKALQVILGTQ